jgi:hypothetical protein
METENPLHRKSRSPQEGGGPAAARRFSLQWAILLFAFAVSPLYGQAVTLSSPVFFIPRSAIQAAQKISSQPNQGSAEDQSQSNLPLAQKASSGQVEAAPQTGDVMGTVIDMHGSPVPGATVILRGPIPATRLTATTNADGFFEIHHVNAGISYRIVIRSPGFAKWTKAVDLTPGQLDMLTGITLHLAAVRTTITVSPATTEQIATEQVQTELTQRGFGLVPNFYEAFARNPAPLTPKLKFRLALRAAVDPFTLAGVGTLAGTGQITRTPNYADGFGGFAERLGANYANQFTNLMIGGAILPIVLHQDPRYFYKGTGSTASRVLHAISAVVIAKGDNGRWQPNYSELGGDLASAALSNVYYPEENEGVGLVFVNFGIDTGIHLGMRFLQEFVFRP